MDNTGGGAADFSAELLKNETVDRAAVCGATSTTIISDSNNSNHARAGGGKNAEFPEYRRAVFRLNAIFGGTIGGSATKGHWPRDKVMTSAATARQAQYMMPQDRQVKVDDLNGINAQRLTQLISERVMQLTK